MLLKYENVTPFSRNSKNNKNTTNKHELNIIMNNERWNKLGY